MSVTDELLASAQAVEKMKEVFQPVPTANTSPATAGEKAPAGGTPDTTIVATIGKFYGRVVSPR